MRSRPLVRHPLWDAALQLFGGAATFTPEWYVIACISFDVLVGVFIQIHRSEL